MARVNRRGAIIEDRNVPVMGGGEKPVRALLSEDPQISLNDHIDIAQQDRAFLAIGVMVRGIDGVERHEVFRWIGLLRDDVPPVGVFAGVERHPVSVGNGGGDTEKLGLIARFGREKRDWAQRGMPPDAPPTLDAGWAGIGIVVGGKVDEAAIAEKAGMVYSCALRTCAGRAAMARREKPRPASVLMSIPPPMIQATLPQMMLKSPSITKTMIA